MPPQTVLSGDFSKVSPNLEGEVTGGEERTQTRRQKVRCGWLLPGQLWSRLLSCTFLLWDSFLFCFRALWVLSMLLPGVSMSRWLGEIVFYKNSSKSHKRFPRGFAAIYIFVHCLTAWRASLAGHFVPIPSIPSTQGRLTSSQGDKKHCLFMDQADLSFRSVQVWLGMIFNE